MGCDSSYMEPTNKERKLQKTAKLYRYALKREKKEKRRKERRRVIDELGKDD